MRKVLIAGLVLVAVVLSGCDGRLLINLDVPIVVEPLPPRYSAEFDGYISYDYWTERVSISDNRNRNYYEPLSNAKVTVEETGKVAYTDRSGYFYLRDLPWGSVTLVVQHPRIRGNVYFTVRSR